MVVAPEADVEVVISGVGGYFPHSSNIEELQQVLMDHVECIDTARWKPGQLDICDKTGNVQQINFFDASYFGIHRLQALFMDPMARMVLQNTLEAVIDSGTNPALLRGRQVLVAAASSVSENDSLMFENVENGFGVTGQARAMLANRVSYWLNVLGPSFSCDHTWVGGLQVLHHAYHSIRNGQCEAAVVIGANLTMNMYPSNLFNHLKLTSKDGHTRSFDENSDGYARSDGICVLFLQRGDQARRRYATVVDVDLMYNGYRMGQYVSVDPDVARNFITGFYQRVGIDPSQITYVESYGAAVKNLDKIELQLFDEVFNGENRKEPLLIGAVKSNLGHSEPTSVFASIVKVIIAMESGTIPANLDAPAINDARLQIVSENTPWSGSLAAINGFGLTSSYGHALLRRNPVEKKPNTEETEQKLPLLYAFSTRTEDGIKEVVEKVKSYEVLDADYMNLMNDAFAIHIPGYLYKGYVLKYADQTCKEEIAYNSGRNRPIWFVYSGMGSQWLGMGKDLLNLPTFARAIERCAIALKPFNIDLMRILTSDDKTMFDTILNSFVGIAAVQIGLTDILTELGIVPDGIIGHSVGELGCAYADGCLTAEQMILAAYYRGRASLEAVLIPGLMAAVGMGAAEAEKWVTHTVDIACHNGPDSCTLSGPKEDMEGLVKKLQLSGLFARLVNVAGIAYHSRYIRPAAPLLLDYLNQLIPEPKERSAKWLSSSVPEPRWQTELARCVSPDYLTNNLLSTVYFEETLKHIPKGAMLIEVAPHGLLQAILKRSVHQDSVNIALTRRGCTNGLDFLFTAIGKMYLAGVQMNLSSLYENTYSLSTIVPRGTPCLASLVHWSHSEQWRTGIDEFKDYSTCEQSFRLDSHREFREEMAHRAFNSAVIPMTAYLPLVCLVLSNTKKVNAAEFTNIFVKRHRTLPVRNEYIPPVRLMVQRTSGLFEVSDRYGVVSNGQVTVPDQVQLQKILQEIEAGQKENKKQLGEKLFELSGEEVYRELAVRGLELSEAYRAITELHVFKNGVEASIVWKNSWSAFSCSVLHILMMHPTSSTKDIIPGYIRRLAINLENLPQEGTVIQVYYNRNTNALYSSFMLMQAVQCTSLPPIINTTVAATATRFIPHQIKDKGSKVDIQMMVNACLQITGRHLKKDMENLVIVHQDPSTTSVRNIVKKTTEYNTSPKVKLHIVYSLMDSIVETLPAASLVVINSDDLESLEQYLEKHPDTHVLLCSENRSTLNKPNLIEILTYQQDSYKLRLLKQVCNEKPVIVNATEKIINNEYLDNITINWVRDLHAELLSDSNNPVYIACTSLPSNDVDSFVATLRQLKGGHKARLVVILDENAPKFTATEQFYSHVFKQDLTVMIYEHKMWGSRYSTTIRFTGKALIEDDNQTKLHDAIALDNVRSKINEVDVRYLGVHASNIIPIENNGSGTSPKLGLVDYCGIKKSSNSKVMGICDSTLHPDQIFEWSLPAGWSFVDGATVPTAYALAYYVLVELTNVEAGETVLIHNACSAAGQAMINVAYSIGARILTSVATERQRSLLLQHMLMLTNENVFDFSSSKFEHEVMTATQGDGVRVLINCVQGERLRAGIRCVGILGRAVLLQDDTDASTVSNVDSIGMSSFFRCVGMYGVHPARLCELREETKRRIHQLIQEGLNNGSVVPIRRNIFRHQQSLDHIIRYVTGPQVTGCAVVPVHNDSKQSPEHKLGYYYDSNSTYVVYGGNTSEIEHMSITSIWLAKHGAKKLFLVSNSRTNSDTTFLQRQLRDFNIHVEFTNMLPSTEELTKVAGVIMLPGAKMFPPTALPPGVRLVMYLEKSSLSSLPPHPLRSTLRASNKTRYENIVHFLNHALSETVDLVIMDNEDDDGQTVQETFTYKDFFRLLAGSVPSLAAVKPNTADISVELITSASPRRTTEVPPLFLIPGLLGEKCKYLQQTVKKLMCPVYVINAEQKNLNGEQLFAAITKRIRETCPKGPYNIVGVSTGGVLALEVAKYLEEIVGSNSVQLYLLDAIPATVQHLILEAQRSSTSGLDEVILKYFIQLNQPEVIGHLTTNHKTWRDKLNEVMNQTNYTLGETQQVYQTLNMIRESLNQIQNYTPSKRLLNAPTRVLRPHESTKDLSNSLINTCKQVKVDVIKGNHFTMLQSQSLVDYINENMIVPPIYT